MAAVTYFQLLYGGNIQRNRRISPL